MKKVIFLCLLSLSVCLSKPAEDQAPPNQTAINVTPETKPLITPEQVPVSPVSVIPTSPANQKGEQTPVAPQVTDKETAQQNTTQGAAPSAVSPASGITPKETASSVKPAAETSKPAEDNKTTGKEIPQKPTEDSTKTSAETKTSNKTSNDIKPDEGMAKNGTVPESKDMTPKPEFPKTTEAPKSDKPKNIVQARGFDGPSFIGGIILTLGLLAIGFMGFKYYKNQTERNYHTL